MPSDGKGNDSRISSRQFYIIVFAISIISFPATYLVASKRSYPHTPPPGPALLSLIAEPSTIELGRLKPGQNASRAISLRNRGSAPVTIERIETSCPCISAKAAPSHVRSGESALLTVNFDASEDPQFRGRLAVECIGLSSSGEPVFRCRVDLSVVGATIADDTASPTSLYGILLEGSRS